MLKNIHIQSGLNVFDQMHTHDFEHISFFCDPSIQFKSIISIHDTTLGPSLGGCRYYPYASEDMALIDVMKLSRAMTLKASISGLNLGGGKSVIIADPKQKTSDIIRAFARSVDRLGGKYYTAVDSGTNSADMDLISEHTKYVTGTSPQKGGADDPSPITALGVFEGIKASLKFKFGSDTLNNKTIAIQGVGNVGGHLAKHLASGGAKLVVADTNKSNIDKLSKDIDFKVVEPKDILVQACDVLAPCAMGGVIEGELLNKLQTQIIAGAANNQLAHFDVSKKLHDQGVLYAPDFVINAGGLIHVACELEGYQKSKVIEKTKGIYSTLFNIFESSKSNNIPTNEVAIDIALKRIQTKKQSH